MKGELNMTTSIRPAITKKNQWYISKHRYYELKHFCMQYPEWKKKLREADRLRANAMRDRVTGGTTPDPTADAALERIELSSKIEMIAAAAKQAGEDLWELLLKSVTEDISYAKLCPPCCQQVWYRMYRKFFWLLDTLRR